MTKTNLTRSERKEQLFRAKLALYHTKKQHYSGLTAEQNCGCSPIGSSDRHIGFPLVKYKSGRKVARFSGLQRSSSNTCPEADYRKQIQRKGESVHLVQEHYAAGGSVVFVTMTMSLDFTPTPDIFYSSDEAFRRAYKNRNNPIPGIDPSLSLPKAKRTPAYATWLEENPQADSHKDWEFYTRHVALNEALEKTFDASKNPWWKQNRERFGYLGRIVVLESVSTPKKSTRRDLTTYTEWKYAKHNIHHHDLLFFDHALTDAELAALKVNLHRQHSKAIERHGFTSQISRQEVKLIPNVKEAKRVAEYISKLNNIAYVIRREIENEGKPQLEEANDFYRCLRDAEKDEYAKLTWQNRETALAGKRLFRITDDLRARYGLAAFTAALLEAHKASIEEVEQLCYFDRDTWADVLRNNPQLRQELISVAELEGSHAVRAMLDDLDIPYHSTPNPLPLPEPTRVTATAAAAATVPHPVWSTPLQGARQSTDATEGVLV